MTLTAECVKRIIPKPVKKVIPRETRKQYSSEFKENAVARCDITSTKKVAEALGVNRDLLRKWCRELREEF